jgi:hypothetical protein
MRRVTRNFSIPPSTYAALQHSLSANNARFIAQPCKHALQVALQMLQMFGLDDEEGEGSSSDTEE